ncbi:MAG TPA: DUF465 domain-containing protein [Caulobacteraceae bacterium]
MTDDDMPPQATDGELRARLALLREEHHDLGDAIEALEQRPQPDLLQVARLKRRKLALRDAIQKLEDRLTPDIIA